MLHDGSVHLLFGAVALGAVHGIEPGHGWPVAASYALDRTNTWLYGFVASLIIGVGHLISSIAMVAVFFYAKSYFDLTQVNEPITVLDGIQIGGPVSLVAGVLLVVLGLREYFHGHSHGHGGHGHDHQHGDHSHDHGDSEDHQHDRGNKFAHIEDHGHAHDRGDHAHGHGHDHGDDHSHDHGHSHGHSHDHADRGGILARLKGFLPFVGGHSHSHGNMEEAADRGLWGIAWFAFLLGFAHEEEFEIIALCAGSEHCLELMGAYAITVIVGIVGLTMLLIGGYHHFEETVERYTPYLPAFSAAVLIVMGVGFIVGLL